MSNLPDGWTEDRLGDVGGLGARRPRYFGGETPYVATADVRSGMAAPSERFEYGSRPARADLLLVAGDVLQAKMRATDKALLVSERESGWLASTGFAQFQSALMRASPRFLYHFVGWSSFLARKDALCVGSTQQAISDRDLSRISIRCPSAREQVRIAEILDTLDEAIRSTEHVIAKLQQVKQGLLHDLLTRGIDENGELRDPERHPEQFQDSFLGRIPRAWDVADLGSLLVDRPRNGIYKPASEIGSGTLIVGQLAFTDRDRVDYAAARRAHVTRSEHAVYGLREGDLLVTRVFAVVTGVGRSILVDEPPEDAVYESNMMRLRVGGRAAPSWVYLAMKQPSARRHLEAHANASNQTSINQVAINSMPCPVAPLEEQWEAVRRVRLLEAGILAEAAALAKLRTLKLGVMDDLLCGRVRVRILAEATP